jgi:glycosyltransferase involved in cell wall biosynthesis
MNIAFVIGYLGQQFGGPPNMVLHLGQALAKFGNSVAWWATATDDEGRKLASPGNSAFLYRPSFPRSWYRSYSLLKNLRFHQGDYDLYHLNQVWDYPVYAGARVARQAQRPYIITPHGIFMEPWRYAGPKKAFYLKFLAIPFLKKASCIHAVTAQEIFGFCKAGITTPYTVVPNGVNSDEYRELPSKDSSRTIWPQIRRGPMVLYLGRLSKEKGLDKLITSWKRVNRLFPSAQLMIAGPDFGNYRQKLELMIKIEGLQSSISMPGMIGGKAKLAALGLADIYIQPSLTEAFSTSVLEALACAIPCVVTNRCNFSELADAGAGEIVEPISESLSDGIIKLLFLDEHLRREMGNKGRELVKRNYSWDIAARKMLTVYRCMLEKKPIPLYPEPALIP